MLILRRDRELDRVYHVAASLEALQSALAEVVAPGPLVADVIGGNRDLPAVTAAYESNGFQPYRRLVRMVRAGGDAGLSGQCAEPVRQAGAADAREVYEFLHRLLDPWSDQPPSLDEIRRAVEAGGVIISRPEKISGALIFETIGVTSILRYWYVEPGLRDRGTGGALLRAMLRACRESRRILLWVRADNDDAISRYARHGFRMEGLADQILIRRT